MTTGLPSGGTARRADPVADLTVAELRGPLLGEGPRALAGVVAAEDLHADPGLDPEGLVLRQALGLPDRAEDRPHRHRAVRGDLPGDSQGGGQRLAVRHHVADQAD